METYSDRFLRPAGFVANNAKICQSSRCDQPATSKISRFSYNAEEDETDNNNTTTYINSKNQHREQSYTDFTMKKKHNGSHENLEK